MILDEIVAHKRAEIAERKARASLAQLAERAKTQPAPHSFAEALRGPGVSLIAEIKRASPSKGVFASDLRADETAAVYVQGGAAAISVLTDERFFLGSLADLQAAKQAVDGAVPILRKDFVLDPYQVVEARASGADAVLLIVRILTDDQLGSLLGDIACWGMTALVEVHDEEDVRRIRGLTPAVVGINRRNLSDFSVNAPVFERLRRMLPGDALAVAASGVRCAADVTGVAAAGADAVLVGEALVTASDPARKLRELMAGGLG